jgi:integrative and conjugative element protein (TIGR02256 family)
MRCLREQRPVIFERPEGGLVKLDDIVVAQFDRFVQRGHWDREACGVLMGRYLIAEPHVIVDTVTVPCAADHRTRFRAFRSYGYHQQCVDSEWRRSGGTCVYLGEWHSHPEAIPTPSRTDLDDWNRRMREDTIGGESFFFVIVGQQRIRMWEGDPATASISECNRRREYNERA